MKELINAVKGEIAQHGYKKDRNSFWKIENGFYKLIDFQKGAHGDYFFINVGIHPVGLPSLITGKLEIKERRREHECIIRQRIGEIVPTGLFQRALPPIHDADAVGAIIASIPAVERWLADLGSFDTLANKDFSELSKMMPIAPILWRKAYYMLKCYCMLKRQNFSEAEKLFHAYLAENRNMDFSAVDHYMGSLLDDRFEIHPYGKGMD